jgi:hypothetical protein
VHPGGIGLGSLGELVKGDAPDGMAAPSRGDQAGEVGKELARWPGGNGGKLMCWRRELGTADEL